MVLPNNRIQQLTVPQGNAEDEIRSHSSQDGTPETQPTADDCIDEEIQLRGPPRTISTSGGTSDMLRRLNESFKHLKLSEEGSDDDELSEHQEKVIETAVAQQGPLGVPSTGREYSFVIAVGTLLSFNTGFVNGSCLTGFVAPSGTSQQVSGFTTPYTLSALGLAAGDFDTFRFQLCMILCFIFGSFIAGALTPKATPYRIEPTYGPTFLIGAALLGMSSILAALESNEDFIFYLAAAASGVQNGISSTYSANLLRSSGMTGTSTDIGIFIGQVVRGNHENAWKLLVLVVLAISFYTGGVISFYVTREFTTLSLLFNASLFLLIGLLLIGFLTYELNISFRSAMFGTWQWQRAAEKLQDAFATKDGTDGTNKFMTQEQLEEVFERVDVDKSGGIDRDELHNALTQTGIKISRRESNIMMKFADKDGDGVLSKREWCNAVQGAYQGANSGRNTAKNSMRSSTLSSLRNAMIRSPSNASQEGSETVLPR